MEGVGRGEVGVDSERKIDTEASLGKGVEPSTSRLQPCPGAFWLCLVWTDPCPTPPAVLPMDQSSEADWFNETDVAVDA